MTFRSTLSLLFLFAAFSVSCHADPPTDDQEGATVSTPDTEAPPPRIEILYLGPDDQNPSPEMIQQIVEELGGRNDQSEGPGTVEILRAADLDLPTTTPSASTDLPFQAYGVNLETMEPIEIAPETLESMQNVQGLVIDLLRTAAVEYPIEQPRVHVAEMMELFENGELVIGMTSMPDSNRYASYGIMPDGRPQVLFHVEPTNDVLQSLAEVYGTEAAIIDPVIMDWFVFLSIHEWHHHILGHGETEEHTPEVHWQHESEVWAHTTAELIIPIMQSNHLEVPPVIEWAYAGLAYVTAEGDQGHPAWIAFIDWYMGEGSVEALDSSLGLNE